jgi:hypothetical protein
MALMRWIKTAGVSEMNYNMFWACCRDGSDHYVARCRVEMKVGKDSDGDKNSCVNAQIYEFEYSKKCGEPREPRGSHCATSMNNV